MEKKRYRVVTFRGYYDTDDIGDAIEKSEYLISEIADDNWDCSFQWARIIDNQIGVSLLVYRDLNRKCHFTNGLALR